MSPENITPPQEENDARLLWKYPKLRGKIGLRVSVDWTGVKEPGPHGEYKLTRVRENFQGQPEGEVMIAVNGVPTKWWVPIDNIHDNED
ncbi:MAG: hypothetical protein G01um10148_1003 [Parcubacteria group bacterium Gr01-1014_8]|nr:MAG: hypothetical protein G01um10148_1003 [Parcubacteria group bacterium Gr01-1014_8]